VPSEKTYPFKEGRGGGKHSRPPAHTSRIKHQIARIRGHQNASLNDFGVSLDCEDFRFCKTASNSIVPKINTTSEGKVIQIA
jgi:hypothetical protein